MKLKTCIFCFLLLACSNIKKENSSEILTEEVFVEILKEVHLAEANFELQKTKDVEWAKNELTNAYYKIYSANNISEEEFHNTLSYYSENPDKLEEVYALVLQQLTKKRTNLDP